MTLDDDVSLENDQLEEQGKAERDDFTEETYDAYIGAELLIPHGDTFITGRVIKRTRDEEGNPIGRRHTNPLLDTQRYEVEFGDGSTSEYTANLVAKNIYAQCDDEGKKHMVFKEIVDHRKDQSAISKEGGFIVSTNGNLHKKHTTQGWDICIEWCDGSTSWLPLRDVKEANPIELAEYAIANKIADKPAFHWWVPDIQKRRNQIVSQIKTKYWRTTHKFGIKIPKSVEHALQIDREMGTDYWRQAIKKEMKNVCVAFQKWDGGGPEQA